MTRRGAGAQDEGIALVFVLLCVLISVGLALGMLGVLAGELVPTVHQRKAARTIAASQAGLQAGLAAVRASTTTSAGLGTVGDRTRLPCLDATPLTGAVGGLQGNPSYAVRVRYYTLDPSVQSAVWRNAAANQVACVAGSGTAVTPLYALIQSQATGDALGSSIGTLGDRSSEIVYSLNRTDQAFLGGLVHTGRGTTSNDLCWETTALPAVAGTTLRLAVCRPGNDAQTFSYRIDYSIALSITQTATNPPTGGLCVDGDRRGSSWQVTLQACDPTRWQQLWSYNDNGRFEAENSSKTSLAGLCLGTNGTYTAGAALTVDSCLLEWNPERTLGAGASGTPTSQLINYAEYGRCLDVTNQDVTKTWLIAYPCKQDATPGRTVTWNQRFVWDGASTLQLQTQAPQGLYCITTAAAAGGRALTRPCVNGQADQRWTMLGNTGNRTTSYTVVDAAGRCLSLGAAPPEADASLSQWSMITADVCDGSFKQKWNAPPLPTGANLGGERETTGG